tara:strand:+ start:412 stop:732 length:321 start_codon:yes stop_codon:yes gene_type:complete
MLIGIVLLQSSKTGGMGSALAGNSSLASAFGSEGADKLLLRVTTVFAVLFMSLAIILNIISTPSDVESVSDDSVLQGSTNSPSSQNLDIKVEDSIINDASDEQVAE